MFPKRIHLIKASISRVDLDNYYNLYVTCTAFFKYLEKKNFSDAQTLPGGYASGNVAGYNTITIQVLFSKTYGHEQHSRGLTQDWVYAPIAITLN